jgi:hypothetical protein
MASASTLSFQTPLAAADQPTAGEEGLAHSRWALLAFCLYIMAQGFTIPVLAIGPSWAIWPTLPDFATAFLGVTALLSGSPGQFLSATHKTLVHYLVACLLACFVSFIFLIRLLPDPSIGAMEPTWGAFQLYRLVQFFIVFWAAARIPLSPQRIRMLSGVVAGVFYLVCLGVILTFFNVLPPEYLTLHLPRDPIALGPWADYALGDPARGWGTIGYNHAYVAAQILVLLALYLRLRPVASALSNIVPILPALAATFLTGSRAGFAATGLFAVLQLFQRPTVCIALFAAMALLAAQYDWDSLPQELGQLTESQREIFDPLNRHSLHGRTEIWQEHLDFLQVRPWLWASGAGFGSVVQTGNAHCLYLQILVELGVAGLVLWLGLVAYVLNALHRREPSAQPIFWLTVTLLVASLTQETFYPVPAFGHLLGLYLACLAITLRGAESRLVGPC